MNTEVSIISTPFFSVIVPAYNAEDHIRPLLKSIVSQTFDDYELIVVCDSCIDKTEEIARSYGAKVLTVNYNRDGLTRNAGLDAATGEWVLFADDDDWFLHEFCFQQLADNVGKHGEDALFFSYIDKVYGYFRQLPYDLRIAVWNKCWRRSFIGDTRFPCRHYWGDCDFHNKLMRKPHKFVFWDMPMYYYNFMRKGSISQQVLENETISYGYNKPANIISYDPNWKGVNQIG